MCQWSLRFPCTKEDPRLPVITAPTLKLISISRRKGLGKPGSVNLNPDFN